MEQAGVIASRAEAIRGLARRVAGGTVELDATVDPTATSAALQALPGIGAWTREYVETSSRGGDMLYWTAAISGAAFALLPCSAARGEGGPVNEVLEIRSYNLKPGSRERFHAIAEREAIPMLRRFKIDVVAYGPSRHDADSYYLMRAFPSVEERQRLEDAFYGSEEWIRGLRDEVLSLIVSYTTVVIGVDEDTLRGLRGPSAGRGNDDLTTLLELNRDYVRSVQHSDVARFKQILADDFLCSLPDGSLLDREMFLERTALPATISNLEIHDVNVRLMGDFAIIHAQTTFATADGRPGFGRYTDVWARRDGRWLAVAAHVTRR